MSATATTVRTVTATCPCGQSFQREVKRGRPQVWCNGCRTVAFYDRPQAAAPVFSAQAAGTAGDGDETVATVSTVQAHRDAVNERVAAVYAWWKGPEGFKLLTAQGLSGFDAHTVLAEKIRACGMLTKSASGQTIASDDEAEG